MSDPARYPVPARVHRVQQSIRRSRFITTLAHAPDARAAHAFVERIRDEFPDATHHCFAFVAGPPRSTTHVGMSDDGEPHGTAGRPILTTLLHGGVGEVVAVCTRYFGGVKLGTGGLARAYSGSVKLALESLPTEEKVERVRVTVIVGYPEVDAVHHLLDERGVVVEGEEFGSEVRIRCGVPVSELDAFREAVSQVTRGEASVSGP